jgi:hypothetical protein
MYDLTIKKPKQSFRLFYVQDVQYIEIARA